MNAHIKLQADALPVLSGEARRRWRWSARQGAVATLVLLAAFGLA